MKKLKFLFILPLLFSAFANAQEEEFCKYVTEQAAAQRDLLRSPQAIFGPILPNTGTPAQLVFGVTNSLSDDRKASLTMKTAKTNCSLYTATTEAQMHIIYALPSLEKDVLRHRLDLIQQASNELDRLIVENMKLVDAQNLTRPALYTLQSAKVRLDMSRTATLTGITSPYVPPLSDTPLKSLVDEKLQAEARNEAAIVKLAKQSSWDVKLGMGTHRSIDPNQTSYAPLGAFGEFSLTYSLGRKAINNHLDRSADAYSNWKRTQFDDVANQSVILKKLIQDTIVVQSEQLKALQVHDVEITKDLTALEGIDTSAALTFKNELTADRLVLRVDIEDVKFRIAHMQDYLTNNF